MCCGDSCCDVCSRQRVWSNLYCYGYLYSFQYDYYIVYRVCTKGEDLRTIKLQVSGCEMICCSVAQIKEILVSASVRQSFWQSVSQKNRQTACFFVNLSISLLVRQPVSKSVCPSVRLSVCPSVRLSVCPSVYLLFIQPASQPVRPSVRSLGRQVGRSIKSPSVSQLSWEKSSYSRSVG